MCFGARTEWSDDPAPRPIRNQQQQQQQQQQHGEMTKQRSDNNNNYHQQQYAPPPGQPPSHHQQQLYQGQTQYAPPPGPPPSHQQTQYAPPPGPPPSSSGGGNNNNNNNTNNTNDGNSWIRPPPLQDAQPKHDWEASVPDTSLFPPPPALFSGFDRSPANNATEAEAEAGEAWCAQYPLAAPLAGLDAAGADALRTHNIRLMEPAGGFFRGRLAWLGPGRWEVATASDAPDSTLISYPPLYMAAEMRRNNIINNNNNNINNKTITIYYEIRIRRASPSANIAMGFSALPYPAFRLPGWHRASLAVHGDDGHRYVNDRWGGRDFCEAFRCGETYGIGMRLSSSSSSLSDMKRGAGGAGGTSGTSDYRAGQLKVFIFFTRNGVETTGWDLHEETDAQQDLPVTGLEGFHDLCCTIGTFEGTDFEVVFDPAQWMYQVRA